MSDGISQDLGESVYMGGNLKRHVNMGDVHVASFGNMSGGPFLRGKWPPGKNGKTSFFKRQMGRWAMFRDHLSRLVGDLKDVEGETNPYILRCKDEFGQFRHCVGDKERCVRR